MKSRKDSLRRMRFAALAAVSLAAINPALAWDGTVNGTVSAFEVTNGQNFGFRVYLTGSPAMCAGGPGWAYLNETDSNYKTYVAALMMAKAQGSQVSIYTTLVNGYCQIGHLMVR